MKEEAHEALSPHHALAPQVLLRVVFLNLIEEIGWMGFLQDRLQTRHGPLQASILVTIPFASAVVALLFLVWGHLGVPMRSALGWSLVVAFCTPLWPYAGSTFGPCR